MEIVIKCDVFADHNLLGVLHQDVVRVAARFIAQKDALHADRVQLVLQRLRGVHVRWLLKFSSW